MGMSEVLSEFIESTIKKIVDKSELVRVTVNVSTKNIIIQIGAGKGDLGKIIGKKGRNIEALKIIASAIKNTKYPEDTRNVSLEILEDEQSKFTTKKRQED